MGGKRNKYFLSFVEEMVFNPDFKNYVGGRVEVFIKEEEYDIEEIRFFTNRREEFRKFRNEWDFKDVSTKQLNQIRQIIQKKFLIKNYE